MSELMSSILPEPDPVNPQTPSDPEPAGGQEHRRRTERRAEIPSVQDCLRALAQLPGLIALKALSTGQANAIRGAYNAILQQHQHSQASGQQQLSDDNVLELYRQHPEMISMLEPLLTDAQIKMVMGTDRDGQDGQT